MATLDLTTEQSIPDSLEYGCPNCGEALVTGLLEVAGGATVETVSCPNNCDLREFTFREQSHG